MKNLCFLLPITVSCGVLLAQSAAVPPVTTHQVHFLTAESGYAMDTPDAATATLILNTLTVMGDNVSGLPCFDCVTGVATPNIGLLSPSGVVKAGSSYQINVFLVDENYTGPCTYTIEVHRKSTVIVSTNPTFDENAPTGILIGTALTIPAGTTAGAAAVSTTAVCGSSTTKSSSPIYITR
jgi:hypothetical protein